MTAGLAAPHRGSTVHLVLRVVLLLGLLAASVQTLMSPVDRSLGDLQVALASGRVDSVLVQVPSGATSSASVTYGVLWSAERSWRESWSTYQVRDGSGPAVVLDAVASSPEPVEVRTTSDWRIGPRTRSGSFPSVLVWVGMVLLLVSGPSPGRATRWAWWWLGLCLPVAFAVFLLVEPSRTPHRALTGGKALLLGVVVAGIGTSVWPDMSGVLWSYG